MNTGAAAILVAAFAGFASAHEVAGDDPVRGSASVGLPSHKKAASAPQGRRYMFSI